MNNTEPIIQLLALVLFSIFSIIIARRMVKHATSTKHKVALTAPLVLVAAIPIALLSISFDQRIAAFTIVGAFALIGLIWIITATESAELYDRLRKDGGVWRWIVNESPKRESFLIRGWFFLILGLGSTLWFLTLI